MTELEKIAYAKSFIDKLANGINPLDDTPIPDDDTFYFHQIDRQQSAKYCRLYNLANKKPAPNGAD